MKIPSSLALGLAGIFLFAASSTVQAEDWTTKDGKTYQNVSVVKEEPDAVTIRHQDGGAIVPLTNLKPDLQQRFHYDPATAQAASRARAQAEIENLKALYAERIQAEEQRKAALIEQHPNDSDSSTTSTASSTSSGSLNPATTTDTNHHPISDLVNTNQRLRDDHDNETGHYSMGSLASSSRSLRPDSSDANHHYMGEIFAGGL